MSKQSSLKKYRRDISRCVKCGTCSTVCPSFLADRRESQSPRGRMALVRAVLEHKLAVSELYQDRLATCTTCLACEAACPSNVPVTKIIQAAKEEAVAETGSGIISSIIAGVLKHPSLFRSAAWLAPIVLHYKAKKVKGLTFKVQSKKNLIQDPKFKIQNEGGEKQGKIIFFPGCAIENFQPEIGRAAINVLAALGYEAVVPRGLQCCGRPLLSLGDRKAAEDTAAHNATLLRSFEADAIVTACASCSLTLIKEYPALLPHGAVLPAVMDIHEFLATRLDPAVLAPLDRNITWHDPCHLNRGLALSNAARGLLSRIPGVTLTEMRDADRCCGFGGVMRITHRGLSDAIAGDKVRNIRATGASTVVTGCPGCRMQIADALHRAGSDAEVLHTVQVLEEAILSAKCGVYPALAVPLVSAGHGRSAECEPTGLVAK